MPTPLDYQNPSTVNAVLDSEGVGVDTSSGSPVDIVREKFAAQESQFGEDPLSRIAETLCHILTELKKIRMLTAQDVVPGPPEDVADEANDAEGVEAQSADSEGIEDD